MTSRPDKPTADGLWRLEYHACDKPEVSGGAIRWWRCPTCVSTWEWLPSMISTTRRERYGFLGLRVRYIECPRPSAGSWWSRERTSTWVREDA